MVARWVRCSRGENYAEWIHERGRGDGVDSSGPSQFGDASGNEFEGRNEGISAFTGTLRESHRVFAGWLFGLLCVGALGHRRADPFAKNKSGSEAAGFCREALQKLLPAGGIVCGSAVAFAGHSGASDSR